MNLRAILYFLGVICQAEGGFMMLPAFCGYIFGEMRVGTIYMLWAILCIFVGFLICQVQHRASNTRYTPKEAMLITALAWILLSVLGSVPFLLAGEIANPIDAFFETVSGFTTTGSTILPDLDVISKASLFWRSFTHWIGGMGVLVFLLALLPIPSASFMNLMSAESPGPEVSKLVPRVQNTAKYLYFIYFGLTLLECVLLLIFQMPLFDAITITLGTAGTGGFAVRSTGFDDYTQIQQTIVAIFMLLFGINFTWYFLLATRKWKAAYKMEEVRTYLLIIFGVTLAIVWAVMAAQIDGLKTFPEALHHVFFTVSSIITTTGFATVDFNNWPTVALILVVMIMFIGACAGSTGGGIKVSRFLVSFKGVRKQFDLIAHPKRVSTIRMDGKPVAHDTIRSINTFFAIYLMVFVGCLLLVALEGKDLVTTFTAVAATLNNIGPGLGEVGPMGTFAGFSNLSKLVLSFAMLAGRLELFPMLVLLFYPSIWRNTLHITGKQRQAAKVRREKREEQAKENKV